MIDKEALTIFFAFKKCYQYLSVHRFTTSIDHEPLIYIFGNKEGIIVIAPSHLQRLAAFLSRLNFVVEYIKDVASAKADCRACS